MKKLQEKLAKLRDQKSDISKKIETLSEQEKYLTKKIRNIEIEIERKQMNEVFNPIKDIQIEIGE
jgi:chaperonin cofactor prefoldin